MTTTVKNQRPRTRATNESAKRARREALMAAASELFSSRAYRAVSIDDIAEAAGLAKGTFYLYFSTKEAVFLELVAEGLADWVAEVAEAVKRDPEQTGPRQVAAILANTLERKPELTRLLGLVHAVLEQNARVAELRAFKHRMLQVTLQAGACFEETLHLGKGAGVRLALWIHALIVGLGQMTCEDPVSRALLEEDEALRVFRLDFKAELEASLEAMLAGAVARAGRAEAAEA